MKKSSLIILLFSFSFVFSQVKDEREERIPKSEFPIVAKDYFDAFLEKVQYLKFYKEIDGDKLSYEAKFKLKDLYFSIEFDDDGLLEDIEIVIKKKHIPKTTLQNINSYLKEQYRKVRFVKIQKQYINYSDLSDKNFIEQITNDPYDKHTHYEIIAEVKTKDERLLKEFTFTNQGKFEKMRIVTSSSYEHALY